MSVTLVTGATGLIGRRLIARLLGASMPVRALVMPDDPTPPLDPAVEIVRGDITDPASVTRALEGATRVVHLAAVVTDWAPRALFDHVTEAGTKNVFERAAPGTHVVLASSIVVYGDKLGTRPLTEDTPHGRALGNYGASKQAQERIARELAPRRDLALTVVRPANVYGAGSKPWVDDALAQLESGSPALVSGGDFDAGLVHVDNVSDVFFRCLTQQVAKGRTYHAAESSGVTWKRYFGDLARIAGLRAPGSLPRAIAAAAAPIMEATWRALGKTSRPPITREALNLVGTPLSISIARAQSELGYAPRVTYAEGIAEIERYLGK